MQYFLTPLHTHIDFGFGATGDAFKEAADRLEGNVLERGPVFNEQLPINYLRRHAIELYLKSGIVIIHRRLKLPYGSEPPSGEPHAYIQGKWKPFHRLHSVKCLWIYLSSLFRDHKAFFDSVRTVDWTFSADVERWIEDIEIHDPRSTFSRYPEPSDASKDVPKSVMIQETPEDIMRRLYASENGPKQFILLMENQEGEVAHGYYYAGDALSEFTLALKQCANEFSGTHAALRSEVCDGA
ncbi:MAG: hypothetical protein JWO38_1933 [Gemmataceae bacterium]|nr:hypothetical protein [Gemmataceae bacterium]